MNLNIEQERIKRGWTIQYIADQVGITKSAVSQILKGKTKPSYNVLVKLENLFKESHRELLKPIET
jgi:transcriptional regulator with XRE-family HTH domain